MEILLTRKIPVSVSLSILYYPEENKKVLRNIVSEKLTSLSLPESTNKLYRYIKPNTKKKFNKKS